MISPKRNVILTHTSPLACANEAAIKGGMAPILLVSIHPMLNGMNTRKRNGCHAPFYGGAICAHKWTCATLRLGGTVPSFRIFVSSRHYSTFGFSSPAVFVHWSHRTDYPLEHSWRMR